MKLVLRSLSISSLIALHRYSPIFLFFCDTGFAWGQMTSLWKIMLGWISGMSDGCQANRSVFLCRTSAIHLCSWLVSQPTLRREGEGKIDKPNSSSPRENTSEVTTNVYSRKMLEKLKKGPQILKRRVQKLFTHREGISTPHTHHKGRQPFN